MNYHFTLLSASWDQLFILSFWVFYICAKAKGPIGNIGSISKICSQSWLMSSLCQYFRHFKWKVLQTFSVLHYLVWGMWMCGHKWLKIRWQLEGVGSLWPLGSGHQTQVVIVVLMVRHNADTATGRTQTFQFWVSDVSDRLVSHRGSYSPLPLSFGGLDFWFFHHCLWLARCEETRKRLQEGEEGHLQERRSRSVIYPWIFFLMLLTWWPGEILPPLRSLCPLWRSKTG